MSDDDRLAALRSTAHPLRLRMLSLLTGSAMSAAELARELDISHANASYHLRILADAGEVVVESEEKIRGGIAKRYRHPWRQGFADGESPIDAGQHVRAMATELTRRFGDRVQPAKSMLCDAEMWVPPETWDRVLELVVEAAGLIHEQARPPHTEGALHVNLTMAAFGMADTPQHEAEKEQ